MFRLCSKGCIYTGCRRWPTFFFFLSRGTDWNCQKNVSAGKKRVNICGYLSSKQTEWIFSDAEKGASLLMHITAANTQVLIRAHLLFIGPETWIVSFSQCLLSARTVHNTLAQAREGMKLLRYVRVTVLWTIITDSSSDSWNIFKMTWSCEL